MALISMSDWYELKEWAVFTLSNGRANFNRKWKKFWNDFKVSCGALFFVLVIVLSVCFAGLVVAIDFLINMIRELVAVGYEKAKERFKP